MVLVHGIYMGNASANIALVVNDWACAMLEKAVHTACCDVLMSRQSGLSFPFPGLAGALRTFTRLSVVSQPPLAVHRRGRLRLICCADDGYNYYS